MEFAQLQYALGKPPLKGTIKSEPGDFIVIEELEEPLLGTGEHVYLYIRKCHANTHWVAGQIAVFAGVRLFDVSYAGRKDRHAVTEQWFSCYLPQGDEFDWSGMQIEGAEVLRITRHRNKLRRGRLARNQFEIRLSGLCGDPCDLTQRLEAISETGFPNYYGEQRFGRGGENLVQAQALLFNKKLVNGKPVNEKSVNGKYFKGKRRQRISHNQDIYLSAARSWLFNSYLSRRVGADDWRADSGPLFGKSRDPQPGEELMDEEERTWISGLRLFGLKAATRNLNVIPEALTWELAEDHARLCFALPAGSFATCLLRELIDINDGSQSNALMGEVVNG